MTQPWYHSFKPPILVGAAFGVAAAAFMMDFAWHFDFDFEIRDENGGVYWGNWLRVGIAWFFVASWPAAVIFGLLQISIGAVCRRSNKALQPTRAAEPSDKREAAVSGPRG